MKLEERAKEEKQELLEIVRTTIIPYSSNSMEELSKRIIDHFLVITPPDIDAYTYLLTLRPGGIGGGRSSKPGNILLNWRKLLIDGAESILTIVGAVSIPWLIPLAGLVVWNKVWSLLSIEIDERYAVVIWTMWNNKDKENCIEHNKIINLVNEELDRYNRPKMNEEELNKILRDLEKMECIQKNEKNKWWLREWVRTSYE